jgi:hypothetical protein
MPPRIKIIISIIVALVAIAAYFIQASIDEIGPSYAALAFGALSIVSMWIFPEVSRDKSKGQEKK